MGIYVRRGMEADFDPEKMKPGEWAVSIDSDRKRQKIWMCFAPGVVKRMGTYEDFVDQIEQATDEIKENYLKIFNEILEEITEDKNTIEEDFNFITEFKDALENNYMNSIKNSVNIAEKSASAAANSESNAGTYSASAEKNATATKEYLDTALETADAAMRSASAADTSAKAAGVSASTASSAATQAGGYKNAAEKSASAAASSESNAGTYSENSEKSANAAVSASTAAETYRNNAQTYMNNAKDYMDAAKAAAISITGALKPKGTVEFSALPLISTVEVGAMYNISTEFTSTKMFKDGGNILYPAGTNVYKTEDSMWDCLGGELSDYLMKEDMDIAFEEAMPDYQASENLQELVAGETMKSALGKVKTAIKNVIEIVKLLGNIDISTIGGGTVTGAISKLNSKLNKKGVGLEKVDNTPDLEKKVLSSKYIRDICDDSSPNIIGIGYNRTIDNDEAGAINAVACYVDSFDDKNTTTEIHYTTDEAFKKWLNLKDTDIEGMSKYANYIRRTRKNITNNLSNLSKAVAEQNLEKYDYALGDYFIGSSGYIYVLADMDTYYGGYNSITVVDTHHIGILVNTKALSPYFLGGNATCYSDSTLYTYTTSAVLTNVKNDITKLFGDANKHLLEHAITNNAINKFADTLFCTTYIENLTEVQVCGSQMFSANGFQSGSGIKKLNVFNKYNYNEVLPNSYFWTRSLYNESVGIYMSDAGRVDIAPLRNNANVIALILFY